MEKDFQREQYYAHRAQLAKQAKVLQDERDQLFFQQNGTSAFLKGKQNEDLLRSEAENAQAARLTQGYKIICSMLLSQAQTDCLEFYTLDPYTYLYSMGCETSIQTHESSFIEWSRQENEDIEQYMMSVSIKNDEESTIPVVSLKARYGQGEIPLNNDCFLPTKYSPEDRIHRQKNNLVIAQEFGSILKRVLYGYKDDPQAQAILEKKRELIGE